MPLLQLAARVSIDIELDEGLCAGLSLYAAQYARVSPCRRIDPQTNSRFISRYANRAKNIQNKPKINEDPKDAMLRQYKVCSCERGSVGQKSTKRVLCVRASRTRGDSEFKEDPHVVTEPPSDRLKESSSRSPCTSRRPKGVFNSICAWRSRKWSSLLVFYHHFSIPLPMGPCTFATPLLSGLQ